MRLRTDVDVEAAVGLVERIEDVRHSIMKWLGSADADVPTVADVVALRRPSELDEFDSEHEGFVRAGPQGHLIVVGALPRWSNGPPMAVLTHELAHHLTAFAFPHQPRWLAEGLATYLETMELIDLPSDSGDSGGRGRFVARIGAYDRRLRSLQRITPSLEELWRWDRSNARESELYAGSWFWVHFLLNRHPEKFGAWLARLSTSDAPKQAWAAVFESVQDEQLVREASRYQDGGAYDVLEYQLERVDTPIVVRKLSNARVHLLRAQLVDTGTASKDAVRAELAWATKLDPEDFEVRIARVAMTDSSSVALDAVRAIVATHPREGLGWQALGDALGVASSPVAERIRAYQRAIELNPDDARSLGQLAVLLSSIGRAAEAEPLAAEAVALRPWESWVWLSYAVTCVSSSRWEEAGAAVTRATALAYELGGSSNLMELARKLADCVKRRDCSIVRFR
ncbi:MAG: tetratricopeptide repeat protein [Deltaproteobacteria bacterium]|nr:tetratricopeptide repeat protein [Deltaproteobacteria bacterium]